MVRCNKGHKLFLPSSQSSECLHMSHDEPSAAGAAGVQFLLDHTYVNGYAKQCSHYNFQFSNHDIAKDRKHSYKAQIPLSNKAQLQIFYKVAKNCEGASFTPSPSRRSALFKLVWRLSAAYLTYCWTHQPYILYAHL